MFEREGVEIGVTDFKKLRELTQPKNCFLKGENYHEYSNKDSGRRQG